AAMKTRADFSRAEEEGQGQPLVCRELACARRQGAWARPVARGAGAATLLAPVAQGLSTSARGLTPRARARNRMDVCNFKEPSSLDCISGDGSLPACRLLLGRVMFGPRYPPLLLHPLPMPSFALKISGRGRRRTRPMYGYLIDMDGVVYRGH